MFHALEKNGENYAVVFEALPRTNRSLYGHALQSYLWNRIVSKRIANFGTELKVGDFVGKVKNVKKDTEEK